MTKRKKLAKNVGQDMNYSNVGIKGKYCTIYIKGIHGEISKMNVANRI